MAGLMRIVGVLCAGALLLPIGCAAAPPTPPAPPPQGPRGGLPPKTGVETLPGGRVIARGWVNETDLEGGTWLLEDQPPASSIEHTTVAVLLPGTVTVDELSRVRGTYVGAEGVLQQGVSIRMAGPEIVVDVLRLY